MLHTVGLIIVLLLLVTAVHWYLWWRLAVNTTQPGTRSRRLATVAIVTGAALLVIALVGFYALPFGVAKIIVWPGYLSLALMVYLTVPLLDLEIPRLAATLWWRRGQRSNAIDPATAESVTARSPATAQEPEPDVDQGRRLLLARSVAAFAGLAAVGAVGVGLTTAFGPPRLRRIAIPLAKLPRRLDGLRIGLVSDIHLGPILGRGHTQRVVDDMNALDADIIAVVGDLADGSVEDLGSAADPLRGLRGRLGSYFVTGNHEYYSGHEAWIAKVSSLGLRVLRNERVALDGIDIAGVNDANGGMHDDPPDYDKALAGRDDSRPLVLLAHQPIQATEAARRGVDLQLSGHTHGGQMWPLSMGIGLQQDVTAGLGRVDGMPIYVTRGAGFWGPPVRLGIPPEITLVELRAP